MSSSTSTPLIWYSNCGPSVLRMWISLVLVDRHPEHLRQHVGHRRGAAGRQIDDVLRGRRVVACAGRRDAGPGDDWPLARVDGQALDDDRTCARSHQPDREAARRPARQHERLARRRKSRLLHRQDIAMRRSRVRSRTARRCRWSRLRQPPSGARSSTCAAASGRPAASVIIPVQRCRRRPGGATPGRELGADCKQQEATSAQSSTGSASSPHPASASWSQISRT